MQPPLSSKHLPSNQQSPVAPPLLFFLPPPPRNFVITLDLPLPPSLAFVLAFDFVGFRIGRVFFVLVELPVSDLTMISTILSFEKREREKFWEVAIIVTISSVEMDSRDSVLKVPCPERNDEMVTDDTEETRSRISDRWSNIYVSKFGSELVCEPLPCL